MSVGKCQKLLASSTDACHFKVRRGRSGVIGWTVGLVSSFGRAPSLQAQGYGFKSYIGHTISFLVYFNSFV